jgi:glycosyltransferase involved in cell wall biosynthesis
MGTNHETLRVLRRAGAAAPLLFPDSGVDPECLVATAPRRPVRHETVLFWAGRLEPHKALPLALQALTRVHSSVRLRVAGDGPLAVEWQQLSRRLGLEERVEFLGNLPAERLRQEYREADAFLFTSLRDSTGSVVWQAVTEGLPVITLDHQGVGALLTDDVAIKAPVVTPKITEESLAAAIERFAGMTGERAAMSQAARRLAASNSWPNRAAAITSIYEQLLARNLGARTGIGQTSRLLADCSTERGAHTTSSI